jgi:CO/xanthine dehydrogenase FAD-binding subunit
LDLLQHYGGDAKVLAGGQSLMPLLNFRLSSPTALVDINRIAALSYIRHEAGQFRIGALTRQRMLEFSAPVREHLPLLHEATTLVGHLPIRTRGTLGGSLAHADPAAEYPAVVTALEAELLVQGPKGHRMLRPEEFFVGYLTTALAPDELLIEVRFPIPSPTGGWAFAEFARRHGDFAIVGIAALLEAEGERCRRARLATVGVGATPLRLREAEQILEQEGLTEQGIEAAAARAAELIDPQSDIHASGEFRHHLTRVLTRRALRQARARSQGRQV